MLFPAPPIYRVGASRFLGSSSSCGLTPKLDELLAGLPGEPLVREGLADLESGRRTIAAVLVSVARTRLSRAGLLRRAVAAPEEPELELYRLLRHEGGDAYSRYNALIRELTSFDQALDRRVRTLGSPR